MDVNPYESPREYIERPRRPWRATSTGTKIFGAVLALMGLGQITEGSRLGEPVRIVGGIVLITFGCALWVAGDHPFFSGDSRA